MNETNQKKQSVGGWEMTNLGKWIFVPLASTLIVLSVILFWMATTWNGSAIQGYTADGHYFLSKYHTCGQYVEVARKTWTTLYWLELSTLITFCLFFIAVTVLFYTHDISFENSPSQKIKAYWQK